MQNNLRYQYSILSPVVKLIVINVAIFILSELIPFLFVLPNDIIRSSFGLPSNLSDLLSKPWTVITYAFFHDGLRHIFYNMLVLYFAGSMFMNYFDGKRFYTVYFLGAIAGGLLYILSFNLFPVFIGFPANMVGASAAVMAVLIFMCTYVPNQEVLLFFFIRLKLWIIGVLFVVMDLIQISGENAGGHISHLGGALLGYMYATQLTKGNDIGAWFTRMMDGLANLFKGGSPKEKNTRFKKVYRSGRSAQQQKKTKVFDNDKNIQQKKIDAILDKISKSGYDSLTKEEKDFLFRAGKNN